VANKILPKGIARKMKSRVVIGTLPVFSLRAAPRNACIAGGLCVLTQCSQAAKQCQIISVNCRAEVKLCVCVCLWHKSVSGLTKKAEPPPTRGVNRDSGTASANGGWLRRLVRPQHKLNV